MKIQKQYLIPNLIITLFIPLVGRAQVRATRTSREKYWTSGYNFAFLGMAPSSVNQADNNTYFHRTMGFVANDNGRGHVSFAANTSLGVNAGFMWKDKNTKGFTQLQVALQQNKASYVFNHPYLKQLVPQDHDADDNDSIPVTWTEADKYIYYSASLQRFFYRKNESMLGGEGYYYIKGSFGQTALHRNNQHIINLNRTEDTRGSNGEGVTSKTVALNPNSNMFGFEVGTRSFSDSKDRSLDFGLACFIPIANTYTQEYEFFKHNQSLGKSQVTFNGASVLLNVSYTFNDKIKERAIDTAHINMQEEFARTHRINGRKCEVQQTVKVNSDIIYADIYDKGIVDGDRVSVYLNGELILDNYTTSKKKKEIPLHLNLGKNYLVMHALNLGTIPPNTTAILINDGLKKHGITLNSTKRKSGALEIDYTP